jgi:hypothetical protein
VGASRRHRILAPLARCVIKSRFPIQVLPPCTYQQVVIVFAESPAYFFTRRSSTMTGNDSFIPIARIEQLIFLIRGHKVMLDSDLARIYGVTTARLNQQVKRNLDRFPRDFMFQLTKDEFANLMLQIATSSSGYGGRRKLPYAFTEHRNRRGHL